MKNFTVNQKVWYISGYRFYTGIVTKIDNVGAFNKIHIACDHGGNLCLCDMYVFGTDEEVKKEINNMIENLQGDLYLMEHNNKYQIDWQNTKNKE